MESFAWDFSTSSPYEKVWVCGHYPDKPLEKPVVDIQPVIKWSAVKDDIVPLLNHSDCDGELTPDECRKVGPRLIELVSQWDDDDRDKINALLLYEGMKEAAERNESLEFL
ncbi:hypothetical protein D3C72_728320 [compost metagenome]